jgi:hypothetical protein
MTTDMAEYMRKRRAAGLDKSRPPRNTGRGGRFTTAWTTSAAPITTETKLATALAGYSRTPGAHERSAYLDRLIRGEKPDEDGAPKCGGDVWRSMLPCGLPVTQTSERMMRARRMAEVVPLVEAVEAIFDSLPDLVTAFDVYGKLDPALAETMLYRWTRVIPATLRRLGAVPREAGQAKLGTAATIYVLRRHEHYAPMKRSPLLDAYQAIKAGIPLRRPRRSRTAGSARRAVGQRAGRTIHAAPGRPRKTRQSRRTESKRRTGYRALRRRTPAATGGAALVT